MMVTEEEMNILWDLAKRNAGPNSFFKDINSVTHPTITSDNYLEVKLDDWRKLPQKGTVSFLEMDSKIIPYTKVVSYNGVEYNAVMTQDEYDKDRAGTAEVRPVSDALCDYFSGLAEKCKNGMFKRVMLIQFDKQLAHEQADMKVMLPNDRIPAEQANFYSFPYTPASVRRDKAVFKEKDGVKIEFFALQTVKEYRADIAKKKKFLQQQAGMEM